MGDLSKKPTHLADIEMQKVKDCILGADGELADGVGEDVLLFALPDLVGEVQVAPLPRPAKI